MLVNKGECPVTMQLKRQGWVGFVGEECVGPGGVMEETLPLAAPVPVKTGVHVPGD